MAGVKFSAEAAQRIAAATRKVERTPADRAGDRAGTGPGSNGFWAMLLSADISGLRYTFNKVVPDPKSVFPEAFTISDTLRFGFDGDVFYNAAVEVNGARGLDTGTMVWLTFAGYDNDDEPIFVFSHNKPDPFAPLPPHDHRDIQQGGFAFATFHPGTQIPQQPWGL